MRWLLLLGRLLFGGGFLFEAAQHLARVDELNAAAAIRGIPYAEVAVFLATLVLSLGGLSIVLGFRPRVGLALVALYVISVSALMLVFWSVPDPGARNLQLAILAKNVGLLGASAALATLAVPWPWSLDRWLSRIDGRFGGNALESFPALVQRMASATQRGAARLMAAFKSGTPPSRASEEHAPSVLARVESDSAWPDGSVTYYVRQSFSTSRDGGMFLRRSVAYWLTEE